MPNVRRGSIAKAPVRHLPSLHILVHRADVLSGEVSVQDAM